MIQHILGSQRCAPCEFPWLWQQSKYWVLLWYAWEDRPFVKNAWVAAKRHHFACSPRSHTAKWLVTGYATRDGTLGSPSLVLTSCPVIPISLDPHTHVIHLKMVLNNLCIIFMVLNIFGVCLCENCSCNNPQAHTHACAHVRTHTHKQHDVQVAKRIFALMQEILESQSTVHHFGHLILAP
jgi:hypothetical protein